MKKYNIQELKDQFAKFGYRWLNFHLIAIRSKEDKFDTFDDSLYLVWGNDLFIYDCTTNPGGMYLITKLLNPNGAAILKEGQWVDSWQQGLHKGKPALIQAKPITVKRDSNRNQKSGDGNLYYDTGLFGINIHSTYSSTILQKIGGHSAGCVVLNNHTKFLEFLDKCKRSGLKFFTLTVLNEF